MIYGRKALSNLATQFCLLIFTVDREDADEKLVLPSKLQNFERLTKKNLENSDF